MSSLDRLKKSAIFVASLLVTSQVIANDSLEGERIPTEELVEGIKSSDGRWFEVELIIFERTNQTDVREQFDKEITSLLKPKHWNLIHQQLQPDISMLLNNLPQCYQELNPLAPRNVELYPLPSLFEASPFQYNQEFELERIKPRFELSPEVFYQRMQSYQNLINSNWQFTDSLCLLPNESLSGLWQINQDLPELSQKELTHIPINHIPNQVVGGDYDDFHDVYLIAEQNLKLTSHYKKLQRFPHTRPILHMGWRQPGLSKARSIPVYITAGKNYSDEFNYDGSPIISKTIENEDIIEQPDSNNVEQDLSINERSAVAEFMNKLADGAKVDFTNSTLINDERTLPEQTWQIDGYIQVHLQHYLFINSEFNYRQLETVQINPNDYLTEGLEAELTTPIVTTETPEQSLSSNDDLITLDYLKNYYFKQTRRLYSGDLHYLDHPKFGIIVQIRKYRH